MAPVAVSEQMKALAKDLSRDVPRSPRETLGGYVIAGRTLDKCRAHLNGTLGEYRFNQFMDRLFFDFTGIDAEIFQAFVATGTTDEAVAQWVQEHSKIQDRAEVVKWNNRLRYATLKDMPDAVQVVMEDYIERHVPKHRPVYVVFDIFDLEEGRL